MLARSSGANNLRTIIQRSASANGATGRKHSLKWSFEPTERLIGLASHLRLSLLANAPIEWGTTAHHLPGTFIVHRPDVACAMFGLYGHEHAAWRLMQD